MDNEQKLDKLLDLMDQRDQLLNSVNAEIADMLTPSVMKAIFDLFDLPPESVEWKSMDLVDDMMLFQINCYYTSTPDIAPFLKIMDKVSNASPAATMRTLRVGVPLSIIFADHSVIQKHVMDMAEKLLQEQGQTVVPDKKVDVPNKLEGFNTSELTKEQIEQLMLFQKMQSREKQ